MMMMMIMVSHSCCVTGPLPISPLSVSLVSRENPFRATEMLQKAN